MKLILLHNAVRGISDLRIVESQDEFQSTTQGHGCWITQLNSPTTAPLSLEQKQG